MAYPVSGSRCLSRTRPVGALLALALASLGLVTLGCDDRRPTGLVPAALGPGPRVIFDLDAKPLPEVPLPNDLATRTDGTSPTGKRVNISTEVATHLERRVRGEANRVDGFSTYGPITVRFDAPLDLEDIARRQRGNRDYADDVALLINVDRKSPRFGALVPLDFGQGNFPLTLPGLDDYWENDPRREVANLIFDTTDEDRNRNGRLDPGEDSDDDGWLDVPNLLPASGNQYDDLLTFYEKITNTLIFRPVVPLDQMTRYAVVLTKNLRGADKNPIRSPFPFVNHARQTELLDGLGEALLQNGFRLTDVAFTWAFTTQSTTRDLEALRRGLYGSGVFQRLHDEFPADLQLAQTVDEGAANLFVVPSTTLQAAFPLLASFLFGGDEASREALLRSYDNIDYFIAGHVMGPNLLADKDGIATPGYPADDDEIWDLDRVTGRAWYQPHKIPFLCSIPRKDRGRGAPFPVAIYGHGYQSSRLEMLGFAGNIARHGVATCIIDAYGHGLAIPANIAETATAVFSAFKLLGLKNALVPGRARDLDNDGVPDSGGDFFTADLFHTRDTVRQSVLDQMVLIRALRACDGRRLAPQDYDGNGVPNLACDFDGDGTPDLGGRDQDFFAWGQSLGGILSSTLAGIEPAITAAAPSSGGGGLSDIPVRSTQSGIPEAAILRTMGPIIVGEPTASGTGTVDLSMIVASVNNKAKRTFAKNVPVSPGDLIVLRNERYADQGLTSAGRLVQHAHVGADLKFRVHVAADALDATTKRARLGLVVPPPMGQSNPRLADTTLVGDPLRLSIFDGRTGALRREFTTFEAEVDFEGSIYPVGSKLVALARGWGLQRNTPDLRRFLGVAQLALDPGDPINYAPHYFKDPLVYSDYDTAEPGANVCVIGLAGDTAVPISTGIAIARAAGIIELFSVDGRYGGRRVLVDPENFSRGPNSATSPRLDPPLRLTRDTGRGKSALRIPMGSPSGQHAFATPDPTSSFDLNTFLVHMVGRYFSTRGRELRDEVCMATASCDWLPTASPRR